MASGDELGSIKIYNLEKQALTEFTLGKNEYILQLKFTKNSENLIGSCYNKIKIWDIMGKGRLLETVENIFDGNILSFDLNEEKNKIIACSNFELKMIRMNDDKDIDKEIELLTSDKKRESNILKKYENVGIIDYTDKALSSVEDSKFIFLSKVRNNVKCINIDNGKELLWEISGNLSTVSSKDLEIEKNKSQDTHKRNFVDIALNQANEMEDIFAISYSCSDSDDKKIVSGIVSYHTSTLIWDSQLPHEVINIIY
jgi:WD40 repeat protein